MPATKTAPSSKLVAELADYLEANGFSGNIPINEGAKNWHAVQRLIKQDKFYTFGIDSIDRRARLGRLSDDRVRDVLIEASGLDLKRFNLRGAGYFDPVKSAEALVQAMRQLKTEAKAGRHIVVATGHPGAMLGLMSELASWAAGLGVRLVSLDAPIPINGRYQLDMVGPVFVPSDNCSAWHDHAPAYMEALLEAVPEVEFVVGDHGFVGAALNHGIPAIGFYDTDDPAMPLAAALGLPVTAVPINDNRYNIHSAALGRYLVRKLGK
jgi:Phosphatase